MFKLVAKAKSITLSERNEAGDSCVNGARKLVSAYLRKASAFLPS